MRQTLTDIKAENDRKTTAGDFNTPTYIEGQIIKTEYQQGNTRLKHTLMTKHT